MCGIVFYGGLYMRTVKPKVLEDMIGQLQKYTAFASRNLHKRFTALPAAVKIGFSNSNIRVIRCISSAKAFDGISRQSDSFCNFGIACALITQLQYFFFLKNGHIFTPPLRKPIQKQSCLYIDFTILLARLKPAGSKILVDLLNVIISFQLRNFRSWRQISL